LTGRMENRITFGEGQPNKTTFDGFPGGSIFFIAKYEMDGSLVWAKGDSRWSEGRSIAALPDGGSLIGGGGLAGAFSDGYFFLAHYTPEGERGLTVSAGGGFGEYVSGVDFDSDANVLVTGTFAGTVVFGNNEPNETTLMATLDSEEIFVAKFGPFGMPFPTATPTPTRDPSLPTFTPTPTVTATPTETPIPVETMTIEIPGLAEGARPLTLVRIPSGSFEMGSTASESGRLMGEDPVHTVTIGGDFYMGQTEVTQAQWEALMGDNPSEEPGVGPDVAVHSVTWDDITGPDGFLDRLNALGQGTFRLPSEAEWEYSCRAGTTTRFYFGDSLGCDNQSDDCAAGVLPGNRSDYMWYSFQGTSAGAREVGQLGPNAFFLYDMHGNIREWCQDLGHPNYEGAPTDGSAWEDATGLGRVLRGGDWINNARFARSAWRTNASPGATGNMFGFRIARDLN